MYVFDLGRCPGQQSMLIFHVLAPGDIIERVETYYEEKKIESPGVESKDSAVTILSPLKESNIG